MPASRRRSIRLIAAVVIVVAIALLSIWRGRSPRVLRALSGTTMGTVFHLKVLLPAGGGWGPKRLDGLAADIQKCLDDINAKMSTYLPDSELSRFNAHDDVTPVEVSADLLEVLRVAQEISELTGGAFDVTVGPIVNAYGFGPERDRRVIPDDAALQELAARVGFRKLLIDEQEGTLAKQRPDVYCDLSAIAKGYGVDRVADLLEARGLEDYMVEIGGEVRVHGRSAGGRPWRIGVQKPVDDPLGENISAQRVLELEDVAVATSGDYRNFFRQNGRRVSHTIDPRTGRPVAHDLASVTVLEERCIRADALATALLVMGPDEGYHLAETHSIAALFLLRRPDGTAEARETRAFQEKLKVVEDKGGDPERRT